MDPRARRSGAAFDGGQGGGGQVFSTIDNGDGPRTALIDPGPVQPMGENSIARAAVIRGQARERVFSGAPKFWKITNRAKLGNVKVWFGGFDGEVYPEGATTDKRSWLQPGETMVVPIEAGLHFVGNVFDPRAPEAAQVIERYGGFELETQADAPGRNAPVRPIGGPIGLPDFIIEPMDGRNRLVGEPVSVYELYDKATRASRVRRKGHDEAVLEAERELLRDRISEYTMDDEPIYGASGEVVSTATSRAAAEGEVDMRDIDRGEDDVVERPIRKRAAAK
jgi:hypothetical protein